MVFVFILFGTLTDDFAISIKNHVFYMLFN